MNKVKIEGRVVWDPRVTKTGSGKVVTNFAIAALTGRGERTTTLRCVAWESDVGDVTVAKGDFLRVEGRLEARTYGKDGQKVEVTEVILESIEKVRHKSGATQPATEDEIPF